MKTIILFFLSLKQTLSKYNFLMNMIMYSFALGYFTLISFGCSNIVQIR